MSAKITSTTAGIPNGAGDRSGGAPPKRRRSRQLTEEALYSTACSLFFANGYAATSLDRIASEMGVHKSTIFHYVPNKPALLAKVLDTAFNDYVASLGTIARKRSTASARLRAGLENHLEFVMSHASELQIYLRERQHLNEPEGQAYVEMTEKYQAIFTRLTKAAMAEGAIPEGDPTVTCLLLLGCANSIAEWYRSDGPISAQAIAAQCVKLLLGPDPGKDRRRRLERGGTGPRGGSQT
jgi:AcrR family transcriptional regulator